MKARACLGIYAANSYCFEDLGIEVFCMEELAYCLKEHAFLLGVGIMSDKLLHFIGVDCQVPELARKLHPLVHQKGSLSGFVTTILDYVGFFDTKEVKHVEETVRMGSGLSECEKRKVQIDGLLDKKKYYAAIDAYDDLIRDVEESDEEPDEAFLADLYYNRGVVYANMFMYKQAASSFRKSYELKKDTDAMKSYFLAKRMELSEQEYITLVAKHPECYEISMQVEQHMKEIGTQWEESPEHMGLDNMCRWRMTGDNHRYYEECEHLIHILKEDYRGSI